MNSILIVGKRDEGKSTTIQKVCEELNPSEVLKLHVNRDNLGGNTIKSALVSDIANNSFIIKVKGKYILVSAGAPSEQKISITEQLEVCATIGIEISFLIVAKRHSERVKGINTSDELKKLGEIVLTERIIKIDGDFRRTKEWNDRIKRIVDAVLNNL